jgi:hypothetical protein
MGYLISDAFDRVIATSAGSRPRDNTLVGGGFEASPIW